MNEVEFQFWVFNLKMVPKKAKEKKILGFLVLAIFKKFFFFYLFKVYDDVEYKWQSMWHENNILF